MIKFFPFSKKQRQILNWWNPKSPVKDFDGIIADGSIRAGKTLPMALSFIAWAFHYFDKQAFGMAGKTVGSFRRNVLFWLKPILRLRGYHINEKRDENLLIISRGRKVNYFYVFGGRDESSQDLVQGVTLAGFLFDEVALMPESFVNQATGRCSVEGAKLWFNCNPDSPSHWFKLNWLDECKRKRMLHLHFTMDDNPSLSIGTKARYHALYSGVFFKRFILGLWVMAQGAIYDMFTDANQYEGEIEQWRWEQATHYISADYGTQNATIFLHIIDDGQTVYVDDEYYHSGRDSGVQKTDSQYADEFEAFCQGKPIAFIILDPSAASFKAELRNRGYRIKDADNDVLDGIRLTASLFSGKILKINQRCKNLIREVQSYVWDPKPTEKGKEQPLKKNDHGPDALRYWCKTIFKPRRLRLDERQAA